MCHLAYSEAEMDRETLTVLENLIAAYKLAVPAVEWAPEYFVAYSNAVAAVKEHDYD